MYVLNLLTKLSPSGPPWNEGHRPKVRHETSVFEVPVQEQHEHSFYSCSTNTFITGSLHDQVLNELSTKNQPHRTDCSTAVSLVYMSIHYRVHNTFVCRALHALGRAAPTLGAPQSLGWAAPRFC